jgi:hypothetical protein
MKNSQHSRLLRPMNTTKRLSTLGKQSGSFVVARASCFVGFWSMYLVLYLSSDRRDHKCALEAEHKTLGHESWDEF